HDCSTLSLHDALPISGERRLAEWEAEWLPGYENSAPVRIGNAAVGQRQLDVYGEVIDALSLGRAAGISFDRHAWSLQRALLDFRSEEHTSELQSRGQL